MNGSTRTPDSVRADDLSTTRITTPRLLLLARLFWTAAFIFHLVIFLVSVPTYLQRMRVGCLCDSTMIDNRDGSIVLLPFAGGPLADKVLEGDVLLAVDGTPLPIPATLEDAHSLLDTRDADTPLVLTVRTGDQPPREIPTRRAAGYSNVRTGLQAGLSLDGAVVASLLLESLVFAGFALVALLMGLKRSDHWMALYTSAALLGFGMTQGGVFELTPITWAGLIQAVVLIVSYPILFLFPNGRIYPRWSLLIAAAFAGWTVLVWATPLPITDVMRDMIGLGFLLLGLVILVYRYRRFFTPLQRQQTKWVLFGIGTSTLIVNVYGVLYSALQAGDHILFRNFSAVGYPLSRLTLLLIPITFAFAVFRYRLWDIDLTLNRSLVYGTITLLLGAVFAAVFWVAQQVLSSVLGQQQAVAAGAISAAVTALAFNPARRRVQHVVDRRVFRLNFDLNQLAEAQKGPEIRHPGHLSGRQIGEYAVLDVIGKGGMGEVYKARWNDREVALKILPQDLAEQEDLRRRFAREAQTLTALRHPNIVGMIGTGSSDGIAYLAMEYIEGDDLSKRLRTEGAFSDRDTRAILGGIAAALDYAHEQGFIHRDIKPSNIMVRRKDEVSAWESILMDFGVAKIREAQSQLTGTGAIGTIDYMAPEQIVAAAEVDARADIYALGVMAYEMLTGERPFKGSMAQVLFAHLQQPPPDPRDANDALSAAAARAIMRAMAKNPQERYPTAGEFVADLTPIQ